MTENYTELDLHRQVALALLEDDGRLDRQPQSRDVFEIRRGGHHVAFVRIAADGSLEEL